MSELPQGWVSAPLSDVGRLVSGAGFPEALQNKKDLRYPFFKVGNLGEVESGKPLLQSAHTVDDDIARALNATVIPKDAIAFAKIGMAIRLNRRRMIGVPSCIDNNLMAVIPSQAVLPAYLLRFLETVDLMPLTQATTVPALRKSDLEALEVPLPPLNEQRRIVAKLEKLLGRVDAAQARLGTIIRILKRFRQSVLAAACSGDLTVVWREENGANGDWPIQSLSELFTMRNGKSLTAANRKDGGVPVYGGNGLMGTHNEANANGQIIVIGRVGAQCGNVHYVSGKVWVTDNAIALQAKKQLVPAFYASFLRSQNLNQISGGTGQPYLSQEILSPLDSPVVPFVEQQEIVRRVEALFKTADALEARYRTAKAHVDKLTPSILAKAFRGELVPQDPNDEPAWALLSRIRGDRPSMIVRVGDAGKTDRKNAMASKR